MKIKEIDGLEIFALVDNVSDPFTKNNEGIHWNESYYRHGIRKQKQVCGEDYCRACNGLSLFIRLKVGDKTFTLLFDTGPDKNLIIENAKRLHLDLTEVDAIILSHGHFDHYGGTLNALQAIGKKDLPVYVHPDLLQPRAFGKTELIFVSYNITAEDIEKHGGKLIASTKPITLFDNRILISGEIPRVTAYEKGFPDEHTLKDNQWQCSPDVLDERCLILNVKDKGICVLTGCGHTGVVNSTQYAMQYLQTDKVYFVMGGFHLAGSAFKDRIQPTVNDLQKINPAYVITGHCTGRVTQAELSHVFGERHIPYGVGAFFKL